LKPLAVDKKIGDVDHLVIEKTTGKVLGVVVNLTQDRSETSPRSASCRAGSSTPPLIRSL
jgi:hypothetical protein